MRVGAGAHEPRQDVPQEVQMARLGHERRLAHLCFVACLEQLAEDSRVGTARGWEQLRALLDERA